MHLEDALEIINKLIHDLSNPHVFYKDCDEVIDYDYDEVNEEFTEDDTDKVTYEIIGDNEDPKTTKSRGDDDDDDDDRGLGSLRPVGSDVGFGSPSPEYYFPFSESEGAEISLALQYATYAIREVLRNYVKEMTGTYNQRKTWSKTEVRCLVEAFLIDRKSISEIASEHRRSKEAIRTRLNLLGISVSTTRY